MSDNVASRSVVVSEGPFDAAYYFSGCGPRPYARNEEWLGFFRGIAAHILQTLDPRRVFDAGCAMGMLVEALRDRGVEAWGADISSYAISCVRPDIQPYCRPGSIAEPLAARFDLVTCIEVLEHMPEAEARLAVRYMTAAAGAILFSSTPDDFTEPTHINVHPTLYWLRLFAERNFWPDLAYDASFVAPHAILFRHTSQALPEDVLRLFSENLRYRSALVERENRIGNLNREIAGLREQLSSAGAETASIRQHSAELARTASEFKQAMVAIQDSPGWKVILAYRAWLRAARMRSKFIRRYYEPAACRILHSLASQDRSPELALNSAPVSVKPAPLPPEPPPEESLSYQQWIRLYEPAAALLEVQRQLARSLPYRPKISVLVPVYKVPRTVLAEMVESVRAQTYDHWELCLADADPGNHDHRAFLAEMARADPRIKVELLSSNLGISGNSNRALAMCQGEFVALLDHDDTLAPFALFEVAQLLNQSPDLDFIYSDKDQLAPDGRRVDPFFKPGWSPDLTLSANYLTHLCVIRTGRLRAAGGWRSQTDGAQDWDLFLRILDKTARIAHIPKVLYHWRQIHTSVASRGLEAKPYAAAAQLVSLRAHLQRQGSKADAAFTPSGLMQLSWNTRLRAVVIPVPASAQTLPELARQLNDAARLASGDILVFLDQAVQPAVDTWLEELAGPLQDPGIAVVGAKLFDLETCHIRHAGICFHADGALAYPFAGETDYIYNSFGGANWYRDWLAVSGACFAIRRDVFEKVGGFSIAPAFPRLDVDLCLKVGLDAGLRVLYNPFARMWQTAPAALENWMDVDADAVGARYIRACFPQGDPYFNPNLACRQGRLLLANPAGAAPPDTNYARDSRILVKAFDCVPADIEDSIAQCARAPRGKSEHFIWFLPEFHHPFYGGIHTILRFADYFRRAAGVKATFVVLGQAHPARVRARIAQISPELAAQCRVHVIQGLDALAQLEPCDAAVASLWTTAYYVLRFSRTGRKFYFLQDDESLFYPAGSTSALVEATWNFGFRGICNTVTLRDQYVRRGGEAVSFTPCVDPRVFYRDRRPARADGAYTLFCYARPGHPRNCFELMAESLRILKQRLGDKVSILTAGADWDPALFGLGGLVENLGLLPYQATGALYRICDAGVAMMMTRHPSYLPLELMACGSLVIANRNPDTAWLLEHEANCLLSAPTPGALAEVLEEGLRNHALRRRITDQAAELIRHRHADWDAAAAQVLGYMEAV